MTAAELTARLVKVNAAIDYVLDGKASSLSIAGRTFAAMSLDELERLRRNYEAELARATAGGSRPMLVRFQGDV